MKNFRKSALFSLFMIIGISVNVFSFSSKIALWSEYALRKVFATSIVMPEFPKGAELAGGSGRVVAAVLFNEDGDFSRIKVLSSPGPEFSDAVASAMKQWKIRTTYMRNRVQSDITFVFVREGEQARVEFLSLRHDMPIPPVYKAAAPAKIFVDQDNE